MIINSDFKPAWWLLGPHFQTLWPNSARRRLSVNLIRERFELPDGDFIDTDWTTDSRRPIVIILHGLEGSTQSAYATGMLNAIHENGWRGLFMYQRSCSGVPNRLDRRYHAGETNDLNTLFKILSKREPDTPISIVGYSLGGNILLKWLAEQQPIPRQLAAVVAVSVPFDLFKVTERLSRGFSKIYQFVMLKKMQKSLKDKYRNRQTKLNLEHILKQKTLRDFDDVFTAPIHGFKNVDDYYQQSSSRQYLKNIRFPTLILHSTNDPFMTRDAIPTADELSSHITLELSRAGGHVGFVHGSPIRPRFWLEERIPKYLAERIQNFI